MNKDRLEVGKIINTHGIKGDIKIMPLTDDPARFEELEWVYIENDGQLEKLNIENIKYQNNNIIIRFKEITDINHAEKLKNKMILIDRDMAVELPTDRYFIRDLIGLRVNTDKGIYLGEIKDVFPAGGADVYDIKTPEGKEILIPAIKEVILKIDIEDKSMVIKPLEGLIE